MQRCPAISINLLISLSMIYFYIKMHKICLQTQKFAMEQSSALTPAGPPPKCSCSSVKITLYNYCCFLLSFTVFTYFVVLLIVTCLWSATGRKIPLLQTTNRNIMQCLSQFYLYLIGTVWCVPCPPLHPKGARPPP